MAHSVHARVNPIPRRRRTATAIAAVFLAVAAAAARGAAPDGSAPGPAAEATAVLNPLAPLDTSSPRATLRNFRDTADRVAALIRSEGAAAQRRSETKILVRRALSCLDLSGFAPSLMVPEGSQAAVCLKEVLDRIPLPPDAEIPDAAAVQAAGLKRWRLPGTEIFLVRIAEGGREGDFVFSGDTVAHAEHFYDRVRSLPYRPDAGSPGLLESYVEAGGWMIPESVIKSLPRWAHAMILGETVWQWTAALIVGGLALLAVRIIWRISRRSAAENPGARTGSLVFPAGLVILSLAVDYLLSFQVRFTGDNLMAAKIVLRLVTLVGVVGGVLVAMAWLSDLLIRARGLRPEGIDSQLIRLGGKVLTFLVVSWIVIQAADSLGIPAAPLVAGLGAGGLALALASQYTVENLIAGLVIFADKPVRIGDECKFGDVRGRVERIGLRSTRIRAADRAVVSVPNAEFAKQQLVNFSQRDHMPLTVPVTLPAGLPPRSLRDLLGRVRGALELHAQITPGTLEVRLTAQSSDGMSAEVTAITETADEREFAAIREEVLLAVLETVAAFEAELSAKPAAAAGSLPQIRAAA